MSVLACNRGNCDHVMCDRHSNEYGYICSDCFNDLIKLGIHTDIAAFMRTNPPKPGDLKEEYPYELFHSLFPFA